MDYYRERYLNNYRLKITDNHVYAVSLDLDKVYYFKLHKDSYIKELLNSEFISQKDGIMIINSICHKSNLVRY